MREDRTGQDAPPDDESTRLDALSRAAAAGETAAYRALLDRLARPLHGYAARLLGETAEAEDVTQESFARLWRAYDLSPPRGPVRAWLYRTAHNLCIDRLRRRGRTMSLPADDTLGRHGVDKSPCGEERLQSAARAQAVRGAIHGLPERQKAAILLVHYQGLSGREAARALDIGEEALESLLARGRRALKAALLDRRGDL